MPKKKLLDIFNATVYRDEKKVFDQLSLSIKCGESAVIIGPNGAGKSTFFKCVTGQLEPTGGQVFMRDEEVTGWSPHEIASLGVGIKTQVPSVLDGLTAFENIWLAARRFLSVTDANRMTDEVISRLSLGDIINSDVGQLAHGERQRVELGIVMAADPWLILLDEPAAGMSAKDVDSLTNIIHEMLKSAAVIIVEHDMQFIRSIASTVSVFHQGAMLIEDHVDRVMADQTVRNVYLGKKA